MIQADFIQLWNSSWPAGATMLLLGLIFAIALLIASQKLKVEVDPKVEQIHNALPKIDCGTCGFAGCAAYARAIIQKPELLGKCSPGGEAAKQKIAQILNLQISSDSAAPVRPMVHCRSNSKHKTFYAEYQGIPTCLAANSLTNAQACKFGCLGYGDCFASCKFDALYIIDGLATIDYEKCTGCGACANACPRFIIKMIPFKYENMMTAACSSTENGKATRSFCAVGCIGCGLCAKQSEFFTVTDNLSKIDYVNYEPSDKTQLALDKCPTCTIVYRGKTAPAPREPKTAKPAAT